MLLARQPRANTNTTGWQVRDCGSSLEVCCTPRTPLCLWSYEKTKGTKRTVTRTVMAQNGCVCQSAFTWFVSRQANNEASRLKACRDIALVNGVAFSDSERGRKLSQTASPRQFSSDDFHSKKNMQREQNQRGVEQSALFDLASSCRTLWSGPSLFRTSLLQALRTYSPLSRCPMTIWTSMR